jgi:hypothetical protein
MGCGLAALDDIEKGTIIIKQKTKMGFISGNGMLDSPIKGQDEEKELDELNTKLEEITRRVS